MKPKRTKLNNFHKIKKAIIHWITAFYEFFRYPEISSRMGVLKRKTCCQPSYGSLPYRR